MKPHIRYIVEGQILGIALLSQAIEVDSSGEPINPTTFYDYIIEQRDTERVILIEPTNTFHKP